MAVNGTNGLPKNSMFPVIFEGLSGSILRDRKDPLRDIVTLNPECRGRSRRGAIECGYDGARLMRKNGDVIVIVGDGKDFQALVALGDLGAHKESNTIAGIGQGNVNHFFAAGF